MSDKITTIRCSELDRVIRCPGSRVLGPMVGARRVAGDAEAGTALHDAIARRAVCELFACGEPSPHAPLPGGEGTDRQSDAWVVDFCLGQLGRVPADCALEVESGFAYECGNPKSAIRNPQFILSGHLDAFAITGDGRAAWGFDWKTGRNPVEPAESNWQVLGYVVLLKKAYPALERVTFSIVQPWNSEADGHPRVSETVLEGAELERAEEVLAGRVREALLSENVVNSGLAQCRWCPAGIQCPAIQKEINTMKANLTPEVLAKIKSEADDALLGDMIVSARVIAPAIEEAEALLHARLDAQEAVLAGGGTVITRKVERGAYSVKDPAAVYAELQGMIGEEFIAPALGYPVTRIKEAIAKGLGIPKTGRYSDLPETGNRATMTAESVFDAKLRQHFEQGVRKRLVFSKI